MEPKELYDEERNMKLSPNLEILQKEYQLRLNDLSDSSDSFENIARGRI
jgi:hypothetical protein